MAPSTPSCDFATFVEPPARITSDVASIASEPADAVTFPPVMSTYPRPEAVSLSALTASPFAWRERVPPAMTT